MSPIVSPKKTIQISRNTCEFKTELLKLDIMVDKMKILLGCQYGNPSRKVGGICLFYFFQFFYCFIFHVGKSLACHSPGKWCLCA